MMPIPTAPPTAADPRCPLCGGKAERVVIRLAKRSVLRCAGCTNGWTYPPAEAVPDYETMHFGSDGSDEPEKISRMVFDRLPILHQRAILMQQEEVRAGLASGGDWLDIGCSDGLLLERMKAEGYRGVGIEPSAKGARQARGAGLEVYSGYFPHPEVPGPFAVVHMSHVLEHVPDVLATLRDLVKVAPGGSLILTQTNYTGFVPRTLKDRWYAWVEDHHYYHFTPLGLKQILERHGFVVENIRQASMVHTSRRYRYILRLLDRIKWLSDQFILRARIPQRWID